MLTWTPKEAAAAAFLILAFPQSHVYRLAVEANPDFKATLDYLIDRRIRWHFIDCPIEEVIAIGRAYDVSGHEDLAEAWWHALSGETLELNFTNGRRCRPNDPFIKTEPDMRGVLACEGDWTLKYLARWSEVRRELRALIDDGLWAMAAMPRGNVRQVREWAVGELSANSEPPDPDDPRLPDALRSTANPILIHAADLLDEDQRPGRAEGT